MSIFPSISGQIADWDTIVVGHLRWNRFFGESEEVRTRGFPSTCGSALIQGKMADGSIFRLLIDPTQRVSAKELDFDLNRLTGLHLADVTHCFSSHHHADHVLGLRYLPNATWFAPAGVIPDVEEQDIRERLIPSQGEFLPGVFALPLPGHTRELHGVAFSHRDKRVLIAGDGVMTKRHFYARATEFQNDPALVEKAVETLDNIAESFDIVLPGHDNPIIL